MSHSFAFAGSFKTSLSSVSESLWRAIFLSVIAVLCNGVDDGANVFHNRGVGFWSPGPKRFENVALDPTVVGLRQLLVVQFHGQRKPRNERKADCLHPVGRYLPIPLINPVFGMRLQVADCIGQNGCPLMIRFPCP